MSARDFATPDPPGVGAFRQPEQALNRSARQPVRNDLGRLAAAGAHFPFVAVAAASPKMPLLSKAVIARARS